MFLIEFVGFRLYIFAHPEATNSAAAILTANLLALFSAYSSVLLTWYSLFYLIDLPKTYYIILRAQILLKLHFAFLVWNDQLKAGFIVFNCTIYGAGVALYTLEKQIIGGTLIIVATFML